MKLIISVLMGFCLLGSHFASAQTIDQIKSESSEHQKKKSSNKTSQPKNSQSSNIDYQTTNEDDDGDGGGFFRLLFEIFNAVGEIQSTRSERTSDDSPSIDTKEDTDNNRYSSTYAFQEEKPKTQTKPRFLVSAKQSIDNRKVLISTGRLDFESRWFRAGIRQNRYKEFRSAGNDFFSTTEFHPIGFNTNTKPFKAYYTLGVMIESFSGEAFVEHVLGAEHIIKEKYYAAVEGRLVKDFDVFVRMEGNIMAGGKIKEWGRKAIWLGGFFSSGLFYKKIPIENGGFQIILKL